MRFNRRRTRKVLLGALAACLLSACGALGGRETPTPTLSSADVLQTAEAIAEQTRQAASPTSSPTPVTPSPTATEALTPTPASTATPSATTVTANYNANIRRGPDEAYEVLDFLLQGQSGQVLGQFTNASTGIWYFIRRAQGPDGWIWSGAVAISGSTAGIPLMTPPPTSTPAPVTATATQSPTVTPTDTP